MKKIIYLILICSVPFSFSFNPINKKNEPAGSFKELDNYLSGEIKDGRLKGVHGLVFHSGKVVYDHFYGERDAESKDPMQGNEEYFIQSMTKPIVTVALMTLYEEGKFSLNDPIEKYLPEFKDLKVAIDPNLGAEGGTKEPKTKVTIAEILSHTSGFSHGLTPMKLDQEIAQALFNPSIKNLETRVKILSTIPLMYEPGTKWNYSFSTDVAARLIEVISGKNMSEFLQERVFTPLEMKSTGYNLNPAQQKRVMTVYDFQKDSTLKRSAMQPAASNNTLFGGINGLFSTTGDYLKFAKMILNKGELNGNRILKSETVELMTKDYTANIARKPNAASKIIKFINGLCIDEEGSTNLEPGYGFGLGFCILNNPAMAGRNGVPKGELFWAGYNSTYFFINPTDQLIGIFMTQIGGASNPYSFYYGDKMREYTYKGVIAK
jgi:CubicO group peptidase (beta-lactamase class C family)